MSTAIAVTYNLTRFSTKILRDELVKALVLSVQHISRLAAIWKELERRGEDLSDLRRGIGVYLKAVASGQLAPDALVAFSGQKTILDRISTLPIDTQRKLAAGDPVKIATDVTGRSVRSLPVAEMTAAQVKLAISDGKIRDVAEQKAVLEAQIKPHTLSPTISSTSTAMVPVQFTADDHRTLLAAAMKQGVSIQALVRQALVRAGLLA